MITWVMLKKSEQKACSSENRENTYEKLGYYWGLKNMETWK